MANALPRGNRVINALSAAWSELTQPTTAGSSAIKAYEKDYGPVYAGSGFYGIGNSGQTFGRDKYSAARAYYLALHVYDATRLIMSSIDTVPWQIKSFRDNDDQEGTVIADSRDKITRHDFQRALRNYKQQHTIGLIKRTLASMLLFDEVYIELVRDDAKIPPGRKNRVNGLNWLNSVATSKHIVNGKIAAYHYGGTDGQTATTLYDYEVAYEHGYNSMSDLDGFSPVQALADKLNVETRYTLGILNWLANGIHAGGVLTPKGDTVGYHPKLQELKDLLENQAKGVHNIGRWHLLPTEAQITDFGMPEFDKILGQDSGMRKQVYASFHIPEAMMGIVDNAGFKSGDEVTYRYYQAAVIPYCVRIAEYYNLQLMKYFSETSSNELLVFDTSEWDRASEADKLEADVADRRAAVIPFPVNELRKAMKQQPDPLLENFYMVPGVVGPVPAEKVTSVWIEAMSASKLPALPAGPDMLDDEPEPPATPDAPSDTADDEPAAPLAEVKPAKAIQTDQAFISVDLGNNPDVVGVYRAVKEALRDNYEDIEWQLPPTFHITLAFIAGSKIGDISKELTAAAQAVTFPSDMPITGNELGIFENKGERALHIIVDKSPALAGLQKRVYDLVNTEAMELSEFSKPEDWKPHITLAYLPEGVNMPSIDVTLSTTVNKVLFSQDDYEPFAVVHSISDDSKAAHICGPECDHDHATPDAVAKQWDELETWRKVALKAPQKAHTRDFVCHAVQAHISEQIKALLATTGGDKDAIYDVFEAAKDEVAVFHAFTEDHAKSAVDYRRSVRNLSRGFWNGSIDRRTFISDMTSAIQRAFTAAYEAGLKSEGTTFNELEDDDKDALQDRVNGELLHIRGLADYIEVESKSNGGSLAAVRDRVDNWVRRYDSVRDLGVLVGAGNKKKMWRYDPMKEHCADCLKMNGRVYTAKIWRKYGILPRSAQLECFGIYCGCGFEDTDEPVTKGRPPALRGPR